MEDGAADAIQSQDRRIAYWMSWHLSATSGSVVQPWQLLGEEKPPDTEGDGTASNTHMRAMQKRYEAMMRKAKREKRKKEDQCPAS
jgi:hypothetical protein